MNKLDDLKQEFETLTQQAIDEITPERLKQFYFGVVE